jgi:hypothetical protein
MLTTQTYPNQQRITEKARIQEANLNTREAESLHNELQKMWPTTERND